MAVVTNYGTGIRQYNPTPTMELVTGVDCVADDLLMRITTPFLWYDSDYGYDVNNLLNAAVNGPQAVSQIASRIESEIKKDSRVASTKFTYSFDGVTLSFAINVSLVGGETFALIGNPINVLTAQQILMAISQGGTS